jgi:hypothetical protein
MERQRRKPTSAQRNRQRQFIFHRLWIPAASAVLFVAALLRGPAALWAMSPCPRPVGLFPLAVIFINRPAKSFRGGILTPDDAPLFAHRRAAHLEIFR